MCTPGMGVNLWGVSPLYVNPVNVNVFNALTKVLAEGKGIFVRSCLKPVFAKATPGLREACIHLSCRSCKERRRKAQSPGKLAQHNEAPGSGDRVNAAVV